MDKKLVTVITGTTGNPLLKDCIESVINQTHRPIQHLLYIDGAERVEAVEKVLSSMQDTIKSAGEGYRLDIVKLPYPTGKDGYLAHKIYGSGTYVAAGDYVMFLDDDNYLDKTHVSNYMDVIKSGKQWAYSLRTIVDSSRNFLCLDNCESLGKWPSVMNQDDFFIDVNCYFLPKEIAIFITPIWHFYGKFRDGNPEADRVISRTVMEKFKNFDCTYKHTVYYTAGNTTQSVQPEFFRRGNEEMLRRYNGTLPWIKD